MKKTQVRRAMTKKDDHRELNGKAQGVLHGDAEGGGMVLSCCSVDQHCCMGKFSPINAGNGK